MVRTCDHDLSLTHQERILHLSPGCCAGGGAGEGAGCCLISGFPSSSKMLGSYFGHHPYKKGVTECKYINETYNEQTQEPFPDAHNTQRLFFFSFPSFS